MCKVKIKLTQPNLVGAGAELGKTRLKVIQSKRKESTSCQTNATLDVPYSVSDPLPPIFGSQLCNISKQVGYISRSLPNMFTLDWIKISEDSLVEAAEEALNEQYDRQVAEFYDKAREKAKGLRDVFEENCIAELFEYES